MSEVGEIPQSVAEKPAAQISSVDVLTRNEVLKQKDVVDIKAKAFLKQRYPLTQKGKILREQVEQAVTSGDRKKLEELSSQLPTVENPNINLFKDFNLTPDQELDVFSPIGLTVIQSTKGCSHQCEFCAADTSSKVETMPFPAILKIAQKMRMNKNIFGSHTIYNYYDSDPFDYKDSAFVHEDGTPADYGDVFAAMATKETPIHITTAGWSRSNHAAQRAMQKIIALCEENQIISTGFRVSLSRGEIHARMDLDAYREDMKQVLRLASQIKGASSYGANALFFCNENDPKDQEFIEKVVDPLEKFIKDEKLHIGADEPPISNFSGRQKGKEASEEHDVMACMPGYHIWPDGTIAKQRYARSDELDNLYSETYRVKKGSRPTPIGMRLYTLSDKKY